MLTLHNLHGQHILARHEQFADIDTPTNKRPFHAIYLLSIEVDVCLPIDAIKVQEHMFAQHSLGNVERTTIPKVGIKERFGNHEQVVGIVWIGYGTDVHIARQHRGRHCGRYPLTVVKGSLRNLFARCPHLRGTLQSPVPSIERKMVAIRTAFCLRMRHQSPTTHHFQLTDCIALSRPCTLHVHTHISGRGLAVVLIKSHILGR